MIAKISSGKNTAGLIRYLYGPGRANEHTNPHLVASWDGYAPDPAHSVTPAEAAVTRKLLVADLDLHVNQARHHHRAPAQHVWHCSLRTAPHDRTLADDEWAHIAHRIVAATGIAPEGDPDGCRWIAVRHAPDHIHIAATTVRPDLRTARHWNDYLTADRELATIEKDYGLHQVVRGDRTAAKRPTRAEHEKAHRTGRDRTARERLRTTVRTAIAAATTTEEFLHFLYATDGILLNVKRFPSGDIRGYTVALHGDTNATGEPVWYSGSKLAPDLSLPKIHQRLDQNHTAQPQPPEPDPWHAATTATEQIPHYLDQPNDSAAQAHLAALGETLDALPLLASLTLQPQLRHAATAFERATRSRIRAEHHHAHTLRTAVRGMLRQPTPKDGSGLAMLLDVALLAVIAAKRWHQLHHHDQQVAAAHQALTHLQTAYDQAATPHLTALAQHQPPRQQAQKHIRLINQTIPAHAQRILNDPALNALTAVLTTAEQAGHNPLQLLQQAADQRALTDARQPARVLTWRLQRLGAEPALSPRARAAAARSAGKRADNEAHATVAVPVPPTLRAGRRR